MFHFFISFPNYSCNKAILERNKRLIALLEGIEKLAELEKLILTESGFQQFPSGISLLKTLQYLVLTDNDKYPSYPSDLSKLQELEELVLSAQPNTQLPDSIRKLSQLKRLEIKKCQHSQKPNISPLGLIEFRRTVLE